MNRSASSGAVPTPAKDLSAVERVIAHVRGSIRDGRFAPGQRLIESELQLALGVSRGPIREAIRRLAADNILEVELHKGARVRQLTLAEITAIYEVREVLEGLAARLAAEKRRSSDGRLAALEKTFNKTFDGTAVSYLRYNAEFHGLVVDMAGNTELARLVENLQIPSFILLVHVLVDALSIARARAEHRPIVEAIVKGDGNRAERTMRAHIRSTKAFVLELAAERLNTR